MPGTAQDLGVDHPSNVQQNLEAAATYLSPAVRQIWRRLGEGVDGLS